MLNVPCSAVQQSDRPGLRFDKAGGASSSPKQCFACLSTALLSTRRIPTGNECAIERKRLLKVCCRALQTEVELPGLAMGRLDVRVELPVWL
jgi:hypothetical protein